eukprot:15440077-Alexandrium_andersonii.AAC.1
MSRGRLERRWGSGLWTCFGEGGCLRSVARHLLNVAWSKPRSYACAGTQLHIGDEGISITCEGRHRKIGGDGFTRLRNACMPLFCPMYHVPWPPEVNISFADGTQGLPRGG